jgi:hypothetical protein
MIGRSEIKIKTERIHAVSSSGPSVSEYAAITKMRKKTWSNYIRNPHPETISNQ